MAGSRDRADKRRKGDTRPLEHYDPEVSLTLLPAEDRPFRWLPKHGQPYCIGEWLTQHVYEARLEVYTAIIVTLVLLVLIWGVPGWVPFVDEGNGVK